MSHLKQQWNSSNELTLTTLVDPDQPLQRTNKSAITIDEVLGKGQFHVRAWHSNSQDVDQTSGKRYTDLLDHKWDKQEVQSEKKIQLQYALKALQRDPASPF